MPLLFENKESFDFISSSFFSFYFLKNLDSSEAVRDFLLF
jgi:hypothetical protein